MTKKSQIMGQVFIYILAIVIFSMVLLYGYKAIKGFTKQQEDITLIQLKTQVAQTIESISYDTGTVRSPSFDIPAKYKQVCFADLSKLSEATSIGGPCYSTVWRPREYPIICDSWEAGVEKNLFLVATLEEEPYYVGNITVDNQYGLLCINATQGKIKLRLEGLGDKTKISEWPK